MPDVPEVPLHYRRCVARRSTQQHRRSIRPTRRRTRRWRIRRHASMPPITVAVAEDGAEFRVPHDPSTRG